MPRTTGRSRGGFSLVEVILALAVVTVALVGILALLPVAIDTALDSRLETQATVVAKTIFSDLQSHPGPDARVVTGADPLAGAITAGPRTNFEVFLSYVESDTHSYTDGWQLVSGGQVSGTEFAAGVNGAFFLARIQGSPGTNGLARVDVVIEHPGRAESGARQKFSYTGLVEAVP